MEAQSLLLDESVVLRNRHCWSDDGGLTVGQDSLVVEEPLEIRLGNYPLAVVMRTPGDDIDLVTGFAVTELIVESTSDLLRVSHCTEGELGQNVVRLIPQSHVVIDATRFQRNLFSTSSCGICGKRSIDQAMKEAPPLLHSASFRAAVLTLLPDALRNRQPIFERTGALHAAALFDAHGQLLSVREDVGRHNAVDKVVGASLREGRNLENDCLVVSGRVSYEVVQKALAARVPCVVGVGGVSSLAADLAERAGIALLGFARSGRLSIYAGSERIE